VDNIQDIAVCVLIDPKQVVKGDKWRVLNKLMNACGLTIRNGEFIVGSDTVLSIMCGAITGINLLNWPFDSHRESLPNGIIDCHWENPPGEVADFVLSIDSSAKCFCMYVKYQTDDFVIGAGLTSDESAVIQCIVDNAETSRSYFEETPGYTPGVQDQNGVTLILTVIATNYDAKAKVYQ